MIFTKIPKNFASYQDQLIFGFDLEADFEQLDIAILRRDGSRIGGKRLYGVRQSQIDIAPYVRRAAEPAAPKKVNSADFFDTGESIDVIVEIGSVRTAIFTFIGARVGEENNFALLASQIPHRVLAYDDFDTIGYVNKSGAQVRVLIEGRIGTDIVDQLEIVSADTGQLTIAVTPQDFGKSVRSMKVTIWFDGVEQESIEYEVREAMAGSERVMWLNGHLSAECYTFPMRKSVLVAATRRRMATLWGREAADVEHNGEVKLISAYEPQAQLKALSGIVAARKVWIVRGGDVEPVDMTTDRVLLTPGDGMGFIEVDLRAAQEGAELW